MEVIMEYAFASWSGGKDSCLACYRAIKNGIKVRYLFNMISEDGHRSRSHGLAARWLQMQAEAMGIKLIQQPTKDSEYETNFKKAVLALKKEGITEGVFGDIDFNAHREWIDRVCSDVGVTAHLPLWEENQKKLFQEFIELGFEAVVVTTRADVLGEEWLGRKLDADFLADLAGLENVTPCGEAGEYHTLVIDGPLFKKRLEIVEANKVRREGYWFLEVGKCELVAHGKGQ
jgi:diphthine-ammonia ligase